VFGRVVVADFMNEKNIKLEEAIAARDRAKELLRMLIEAKAECERQNEAPRDLFKKVTGQSSLENAIAATSRTLETFERVLAEIEAGQATAS